ncbi:winged helix-turn-helix domain-containing protein [Mesorhizobium sp. CN5-321]|uniref:winged helix-turn-helix domain-containing protein n=1 Tax=Mesorhizobium hunchu TaxID=3157708 RepID=UPI0032B87BD0
MAELISPKKGETLVEAVTDRLQRDIEQGILPAGSKLPSIRRAALQFGMSKNTIVDAYARLVSSGHASARPGSGFTV